MDTRTDKITHSVSCSGQENRTVHSIYAHFNVYF